MKLKVLVALVLLLAAPFAVAEEATAHATFNYKFDVDSDSLNYCVLTGTNGSPFGDPIRVQGNIKTTGSSATLAEFADTDPFTGLAQGDVLFIDTPTGVATRVIVAATSVSGVDVDSAITLTQTGGHRFSYKKLTCGTTVTNGWIDARAYTVALTVQYEQGDLATGLRVRFECKGAAIGDLPVIVYPGESSDCGIGGTLSTDRCNFATAGETARLTVVVEGGLFSACRVGLARAGNDTSDAGANIEQVTATITTSKFTP